MFDPSGLGAALTSLRAIIELARNANDAQLAMKISSEIANVQGRLIDVQQQAVALQAENQELRAEVERVRSSVVFHHSVNWRVLSDGTEDGPFCPVCISAGVHMRLMVAEGFDQTTEVWHLRCPKCHLVGVGWEGVGGMGRELLYPVPKELIPDLRYFVRS